LPVSRSKPATASREASDITKVCEALVSFPGNVSLSSRGSPLSEGTLINAPFWMLANRKKKSRHKRKDSHASVSEPCSSLKAGEAM